MPSTHAYLLPGLQRLLEIQRGAFLAGLQRHISAADPLDTALAPSIAELSSLHVRRRERKKLPTTTASSIRSPAAPNSPSPPALLREDRDHESFISPIDCANQPPRKSESTTHPE
jgi:hypothetical protein